MNDMSEEARKKVHLVRRGQIQGGLSGRKKGEIPGHEDLWIKSVCPPGQGSKLPPPTGSISRDGGKGKGILSLLFIHLVKSSPANKI